MPPAPFGSERAELTMRACFFGCVQGLITRNILSVPVLLENGKWYGFLDMMVSAQRKPTQPHVNCPLSASDRTSA